MKTQQFRMKRAFAWIVVALPLSSMTAPAFAQLITGSIQSFGSNLCLQPVNQSTAQGAATVQEPCNDSPAQLAQIWFIP